MRAIHICRIAYVEESLKAARRLAKGERQKQCPKCQLWWWPNEMKRHRCKKET